MSSSHNNSHYQFSGSVTNVFLSLTQYMDENGIFTMDDMEGEGDEEWEEPPEEDEAAGKDEL